MMTLRMAFSAVTLFAMSSLSQPALAEPKANQAARDPNQKVCESQVQVGSRLGGKKVCLTRAEWAARKAADRESVEMMQRIGNMPCIPTDGKSASGGGTTC
jgi:hypothetical protein